MKNQTYGIAVGFAIVFVVAALAVIGGIKGLTYHKTSAEEIRVAVKTDPGADLGPLAIQTVYSVAEQGGIHVRSAKVTKVKIDGDRAVVRVHVVTLEGGPVDVVVSYVRGVWSYTGLVQA